MSAVATLPRLTSSRWLPALVMALALLWIVLSLTQLLWQWLAPPPELVPAEVALVAPAGGGSNLSLAQFRLFGSAVDPSGGAYADAPETALNLILKGTSSHHEQRLARAVIADDQQAEKVYKVGDEFPNGVRVLAIYPDRVVLNAAGRIEVLRLRQTLASSSGANASGSAAAASSSGLATGPNGLIGLSQTAPSAPGSVNPMVVSAPIDWEAVRQQAIADPGSIAKAFSVLPVMIDGKLAGVRVSSNTYGAQLAESGLQPDDIVTAVNGQRLDSIEAGYAALDSLKSAGAVTLTVNRDGAEKTLSAIRMPQ